MKPKESSTPEITAHCFGTARFYLLYYSDGQGQDDDQLLGATGQEELAVKQTGGANLPHGERAVHFIVRFKVP